MNQERIFQIIDGTHISEKAMIMAQEGKTVVLRVTRDATKPEIKQAVEQLFEVKVDSVRTLNQRGKVKNFQRKVGRRKGYKKAYVRLAEGSELDLLSAQ